MDDYMKEMMDLKTLVTKTLEKKGVLARIRAELRANVFQAIEEQDHISESEGAERFALLGQCSERSKQLHATPAGKLLTGLLCEYLEWCELDRTLKVYLPELNQPRPYSRSELEELLEIKSDKNAAGVSSEARPLLLDVLEGYLKSEQTTLVKDSYAVSSSSFPKVSRTSSSLGSKALTNGSDVGDEDLRGALESRLTLSNKVDDQMTSSLDASVERYSGGNWHPESCALIKAPPDNLRSGRVITPAINTVREIRLHESLTDVDKPSGRLSLLGDLPPISGRRGGVCRLTPMVLANNSGRVNGLMASAEGSHEPFDVSAPGMQVNPGNGGGRDNVGSIGSPKNRSPSQDENPAQASSAGKGHYESTFGENMVQRRWRETEYDLDGCKRDVASNLADSTSSDTFGSTFMERSWGNNENEDISMLFTPSWADIGKSVVTPVDGTSCAKTHSEDLCPSRQEDTFQVLLSLGDENTFSSASALREKSTSAYFYSESDDDDYIPVEEDVNDNSDGQSDVQF